MKPSLIARASSRLSWVLLFLTLTAIALASCSRTEHHDRITHLFGKIFTSEPTYLLPGKQWTWQEDANYWVFADTATLHCYIVRELDQPLTVRLYPASPSVGQELTARWDDRQLFSEPIHLTDRPLEIVLDLSHLSPGLHDLVLVRHRQTGRKEPTQNEISFGRIAYETGSMERVLTANEISQYSYLRDFFTLGVTGTRLQKMGGFIFDGAQATSVSLTNRSPSRLTLIAENDAANAATFSVWFANEIHKKSLQPNESGQFDISLPAGELDITFRVEGSDGLYLWGAPHVREEDWTPTSPILLITLDTTRQDALSPYNGFADITPKIDAFAREATVYENAFTTSPWTLPSHSSMFTGLYPSKHQAGFPYPLLRDRFTTLAELLRETGYLTAGFAGGILSSASFGMSQGFDLYFSPAKFETPGHYLTSQAIDILYKIQESPFFFFINYFDPHLPHQAPERYQNKYYVQEKAQPLLGLPLWGELAEGNKSAMIHIVEGAAVASPMASEYVRSSYFSEVTFMDQNLGDFLRGLKRIGLYERALVILVADHGEFLGENGFYSHNARLDPELMLVPLIIKWPYQKAGYRDPSLVSVVDLFSTILATADIPAPANDGQTLTRNHPTSTGSTRPIYMEEHYNSFHAFPQRMKIADDLYGRQTRTAREIVWDEGSLCYIKRGLTWEAEPCRGDMAAALADVKETLQAADSKDNNTEGLSKEEKEALKALGYIQ